MTVRFSGHASLKCEADLERCIDNAGLIDELRRRLGSQFNFEPFEEILDGYIHHRLPAFSPVGC